MATAAAVVGFLKKKGNSQHSHDKTNADAANRRFNTERGQQIISSFHDSVSSAEDRAARRLQSIWRGYCTRRVFAHFLVEVKLSGTSLQTSLDLLLDWYEGWISQLFTLFLLGFYVLTVGFQVFGNQPTAFSTESSLAHRLELLSTRDSLLESKDFYAYMRELIQLMDQETAVLPPACLDALSIICPSDFPRFVQEFNSSVHSLVRNLSLSCPPTGADSGFIDNTKRMVGTIYVTQTRRVAVDCLPQMKQLDPYAGVSRPCLHETEEDLVFTPAPPATCLTCKPFTIVPKHNVFIHALTGGSFNLPLSFSSCLVDQLEENHWLDFRTKQVCVLMSFVNLNAGGSLMGSRECFTFDLGGSVSNKREVDSFSYNASYSGGIVALTIISLVLTVCRQVYLTFFKLGSKGWKIFFFRTVAVCMIIASNAMYLSHRAAIFNFTYAEHMTTAVFFENSFVFLQDNIENFELANNWETFTVTASLALILLLCDAIGSLDFHPSTAIVSGILREASSSLLSFCYVFFLLLLVYAFIGMILFPRLLGFASFGRAVNTLLLLAIGEVQELELSIADPSNSQYLIQYAYFWFYLLISTILLMNVLLAIVVGAFVEITDYSKSSGPMLSLSRTFLESVRFMARGSCLRVQRVCCRHKRSNEKRKSFASCSPYESLLALRSRFRVKGCSAKEFRQELTKIVYSTRTVELIVSRSRFLTQQEQFKAKELFLRGFDPNSTALKGHSLSILEALQKGQKTLVANQQILHALLSQRVKEKE